MYLFTITVNVDFRSCINNWCYQHGTMGQYTRCKRVSSNGRTCHNPEIKYGSTVGGKPGGPMMQQSHRFGWLNIGETVWCQQLFPTASITNGSVIYKVTYYLIVIIMYLDHQSDLTPYQIGPSLADSKAILKIFLPHIHVICI